MILITGASRGIGKFLFEEFEKAGNTVYGTYHSQNKELENSDRHFKLDVSDYHQTEELISRLGESIERFVLILIIQF